jgi:hypothetical protein
LSGALLRVLHAKESFHLRGSSFGAPVARYGIIEVKQQKASGVLTLTFDPLVF